MVYIVMGAVAVFCFGFCIYMLVKVEHEPKRHKPAWQDDDADEEKQTISYKSSRRIRDVEDRSTPWKHDAPDDKDAFKAIFEEDEEEPEEEPETVYDLTEKKEIPVEKGKKAPAKKATQNKAPAVQAKRPKSKALKVLEIICGILFVLALLLLILDIYLHSLHG